MEPFKTTISSSARKQIRGFSKEAQERIVEKIEAISKDPLGQAEGIFRQGGTPKARVGDYRILYDINNEARTVSILKIADRKEIYAKKHNP